MSYSFLSQYADGTNLTTYTFSGKSLGAEASDRYIACTVNGRSSDGGARTISSVTIGGVTATAAGSIVANSGSHCAIYIAAVPTGATGDIVVTWSSTMGDCTVALHRATGVSSTTPTSYVTDTTTALSQSINVNAGGFAVGISTTDDGAATATWSGITERFDDATGGANDQSGAGNEFATTQTGLTVSCTWTVENRLTFAVASYPVTAATTNTDKLLLLDVS